MRGLMVVCGEGFQQEITLCLVPRVPSRSGPYVSYVSVQSQSSNSQFQLGTSDLFAACSEEGPRYTLLTIESVKRLIFNYMPRFYCKWSEVKATKSVDGSHFR
jgi:hypothetical protein